MCSSKLEDYVSAAQIQSYHGLRMWEFETQIWNDFGRGNCQEKERVKVIVCFRFLSFLICHVSLGMIRLI